MALRRESIAGAFLSLFLLTAAWGATGSSWGTVLTASRAHVGIVAASPGGTVFSGDKLSTDEEGAIQIKTGMARLLLPSASGVTLRELDGSRAAALSYGRAIFSTTKSRAFVLLISGAQIRSRDDVFSVGQVAVLAPKQFVIQCTRGALTITLDGDTRSISEGEAYRVVLDPDGEPGSPGPRGRLDCNSNPRPPGCLHPVWIPVSIAGGGLAIWVIHEAWESPDRP